MFWLQGFYADLVNGLIQPLGSDAETARIPLRPASRLEHEHLCADAKAGGRFQGLRQMPLDGGGAGGFVHDGIAGGRERSLSI